MRPGCSYNAISRGYPYRIRGTNQQTDTGLLWQSPGFKSYSRGGGSLPTATTYRLPGMALGSFQLHNRAAASIVSGIGVRIPNRYWIAGQWTNGNTTFTDDTAAAQDTTTDDVALETGTNNDGYIIASQVPFNAVSLNISTASVDAGGVARAVRFSNAAGTGWATAPANILVQDGAATQYTTGEALVVFGAPADWGKSSSLATGLPDGYYTMNVRATDAPATTAGLAAAIEIFFLYHLTEAVADNGTLEELYANSELHMAWDDTIGLYGDALVALFSTQNDQNLVTCQVRAL